MSRKNENLVLSVYNDEIGLEELTDDELEFVLEGFQKMATELMKSDETLEAGRAIQAVLDEMNSDEFDDAIEEAEARGSTYWEIENEYIH